MAQVTVHVNERPYTLQCDDGEEEHLGELARFLDGEVAAIRRSFGQVGDIRLLLMSGLVIADRLSDALKSIEDLQAQVDAMHGSRQASEVRVGEIVNEAAEKERQVAQRVDAAAAHVEALTSKVGTS